MSPTPNIVADVGELKERNYMGLSDSTSRESSSNSTLSEGKKRSVDLKENKLDSSLKETELKLGIPGSQSPERETKQCQLSITKPDEDLLFPVLNSCSPLSPKTCFSGHKRGFSRMNFSKKKCGAKSKPPAGITTDLSTKSIVKAQVIGWPPIKPFRKNMLTTTTKSIDVEEKEKAKKPRALFVKVSMDGAPYLRKVNLGAYSTYHDLALGLEKMFISFTIGVAAKEKMIESKLKDMLRGCEYIVTYEDKDRDLMLLGDVPWEMFVDTCKRLRIMKGPNAIHFEKFR